MKENPRFEDWYDSAEKAREDLDRASSAATGTRSREFIDELYEAFEQYGMRTYLSFEQQRWLLDLANK